MIRAARTLLASLFLIGATIKAADPSGWAAEMAAVGLPGVLIWAVIALEGAGGAALVAGGRAAMVAGPVLAIYILPINLLFYPFWASDGEIARLQASAFFKNLALAGGLLYVALRERPAT